MAAAREAKARIFALRGDMRHRVDAARIIAKHASRKDGGAGRHFVNDRAPKAPRRKPVDPNQGVLDL